MRLYEKYRPAVLGDMLGVPTKTGRGRWKHSAVVGIVKRDAQRC